MELAPRDHPDWHGNGSPSWGTVQGGSGLGGGGYGEEQGLLRKGNVGPEIRGRRARRLMLTCTVTSLKDFCSRVNKA